MSLRSPAFFLRSSERQRAWLLPCATYYATSCHHPVFLVAADPPPPPPPPRPVAKAQSPSALVPDSLFRSYENPSSRASAGFHLFVPAAPTVKLPSSQESRFPAPLFLARNSLAIPGGWTPALFLFPPFCFLRESVCFFFLPLSSTVFFTFLFPAVYGFFFQFFLPGSDVQPLLTAFFLDHLGFFIPPSLILHLSGTLLFLLLFFFSPPSPGRGPY